ncbi:MAG: leucine-rich repeat domain-containing protein, partial [Bacteroidales bacterium]|nr:leucine-rich repeat domain-containing protein [Bacteroidales bacterium]
AMAVCGNNQVLADTPEGSDTIFMRFEKYTQMRSSNSYFSCIEISLTHNKYYERIPIMMEIETDKGKSIQKKTISWSRQLDGIPISFADSLCGRNFTVKLYGCEPDGEYLGFRMIESVKVYDTTLVGLKFQNCLSLQWIYGRGSALKSLDLSGCPNLNKLECGNNQLTSLDVSGCPNLSYLECGNNQLISLDVSGCLNLSALSCFNNQLSSLDVSGHTALKWLYCSNNQLTSLDVSGCMNLSTIECSTDYYGYRTEYNGFSNQLTSLDVSGCPNLKDLLCHDNQLKSLEFGLYHKLESLDCRNNQLTVLDMYDISNMGVCLISGNHMSELRYTGEANMYLLVFGDNCFPLYKCHEFSKWVDVNSTKHSYIQGNSQYVPVSLGVNEHFDLHKDMELNGAKTTLRVTRKGGGFLDPKLYSVENDWLSFAEKGDYTVEMTNPKVRDYIFDGYDYGGIPFPSTALVSVFLDVRVGMPDDNPNNPNNPNDPSNPDNPTTANESLDILPAAALQVYPNPATDVVHVELLSSAASESLRAVRILSQSAHLCHSFGSGFDNLSVADLPAGLYFIEAETTTGTVLRQKFVKR